MTSSRFGTCYRFGHQSQGYWVAMAAGLVLAIAGLPPLVAQVVYADTRPVVQLARPQEQHPAPTIREPITLVLTDSTLGYVLRTISQRARWRIVYDEATPELTKRVSVRIVKASVMDALAIALKGTGLTATLAPDGETIVIRSATPVRYRERSQTGGNITGQVVDSTSKRGLSGARVQIQGSTVSVVTMNNGKFMLGDVPSGEHVLTVRLFGYRPVRQVVVMPESGQLTVRILMTSVATVLSGVVTTATGVQQKREVGNDIVTLNVDSIKQVAPITSVTDLLESRVPGLTVLRASGTPGDPARIRIRGSKSITGSNDPIVIVDGVRVYAAQSEFRTANLAGSAVASQAAFAGASGTRVSNYAAPSPLDQMDPNSIETVEVLKGPSASSLYGSDAANGVIVITTKKGRAGPTHWSTLLAQGTSYLPGRYPRQIVRWGHDSFTGSAGPCPISQTTACDVFDSVTHVQVLNQPRWSPFHHSHSTNGSTTVSGGNAALTYSLTGSAATELGYLQLPTALAERFQQFHGYDAPGWAKRPQQYATWGGGGQLTALPSPGVMLTFQSDLYHSRQQRSSLEQQLPLLLSAVDTVCGSGLVSCESPLAAANAYERATSEQLTFTNALSSSWAPWVWLPLTATAGLSTSTGHDVALLQRDIVPYFPSCGDQPCKDTLGRYGAAQKSATQQTLTVNTTIPGWRGRLRTALGLNVYSQSSSDLASSEDTLGLGVSTPATLHNQATQSVTGTSTYGWFFEPRLLLSERFFLTPGFRLDGGNANGSRAGVSGLPGLPRKLTFAALFPKVNFSWVALDRQSGERPLLGALTLLRPRLALGSAGVQPSPGDQLRLLQDAAHALGSSGIDLLEFQTLGNTQLRPERSNEAEGGFDAELWRGRLTLTATHARQLRRDAIIPIKVAPSAFSGALANPLTISVNVGDIRNTSTELSWTVRPLERAALTWSVGGNYSRNDNTVLKLDRGTTSLLQGVGRGINIGSGRTDAGGTRIAVGYPLFGRWERPIVSYYDANQNGIIEAREIRYGDTAVYLGRQEPAYTAAFNTDLTLFRGRLGVHANLSRQGGYTQLNGAGGAGTFLSGANELGAPLGVQASYVAAMTANANTGSYWGLVQTVNEWRFQSLSVNYNAPASVARWFRSQRLSVALQGSNLGLWTNYRGKDPNVNAFANGNATADLGQLAQPRTWQLQFTLGN